MHEPYHISLCGKGVLSLKLVCRLLSGLHFVTLARLDTWTCSVVSCLDAAATDRGSSTLRCVLPAWAPAAGQRACLHGCACSEQVHTPCTPSESVKGHLCSIVKRGGRQSQHVQAK